MLTIQSPDLGGALTEACNLIADALGSDKVGVSLYEAENETLVALGTSTTEVGIRQGQTGMDRQPLATAGRQYESSTAARCITPGGPIKTQSSYAG